MDDKHSKMYVEACIKDIKRETCRKFGEQGLNTIDFVIPKIMDLFFERIEDLKMGRFTTKAMTLNNEELWMFKKDDILKLKELFKRG